MEAYPSYSADEARVEHDDSISLLIPLEDIQHATINPPLSISTESIAADTTAVKKPFLLAISAFKEWIALVTEISRPNQSKKYFLKVECIIRSGTSSATPQDILGDDITNCMQGVDEFTYSFLSLSSKGDWVAISFCKFDSEGEFTSQLPTCCIFHVDETAVKLVKKIKCQGVVAFTPDDHLAIVSENTLNLYNCERNYELASKMDIGHLLPSGSSEKIIPGSYHVLWSSAFNGALEHNAAIHKSANCLQKIFYKVRNSLSVIENEVIGISPDKTLFATHKNSSTVEVYHMKSGSLMTAFPLYAPDLAEDRRCLPESLTYALFSADNEYVFLISIQSNINPEDANECFIWVEVYELKSRVSIHWTKRQIQVDWYSKNTLQPYIIQLDNAPTTFKLVYATLQDNGHLSFKSRILNLFGYGTISAYPWKVEPAPRPCQLVMSMQSSYGGILYQLRVHQYAIELWRLDQSTDQVEKELIFTRVFHAPRDQRGEFWKPAKIETIHECKHIDSLPLYGIEFMNHGVAIKTVYERKEHVEHIHLPFNELELAEESSDKQKKPFEFVCIRFYYIESVFRALRDQFGIKTQPVQETKRLIQRSIKKMQQEKSKYFTTISGSNTLAMLASFQEGRDIIFQVLQTDDLPINLFTYVRKSASTDKESEFVDRKENALTILIEEYDYQLFDLLFNRVLLHASSLGVGAFGAISDALMFLQERSETDILQASCQKLKFLMVKRYIPRDPDFLVMTMDADLFHNIKNAELSKFPSYAQLEQLPTYKTIRNIKALDWLQRHASYMKEAIADLLKIRSLYNIYLRHWQKSKAPSYLQSTCAVPFVYFCSYTIFREDLEFSVDSNRDHEHFMTNFFYGVHMTLYPSDHRSDILYKAESDMVHLAYNQHENDLFHQKGSVIEILLHYKWKKFIRRKFYLVCFIHLWYYVSFCIGILFARECFDYTPGDWVWSNPRHPAVILLMLIANFILIFQEALQLFALGFWRYFKSVYNIIDLAAVLMPFTCVSLMTSGNSKLDEVSAITTIILWMHAILRLRPFAFIGVTLETMIQLIKSVYKTLFIMLLVIFAFTHAFIVLLLHKDDAYFQNQYSGSMNFSGSEQTVNYSDTSASNSFTNVFKAFSTLWLFIYGVWDPITDGDAGDDVVIIIFAMLFSFVTVLLFVNLVIALMSSKAEEIRLLGKSIWLSHFAEVIAEIEQFWCTRTEVTNRNNNPSVVYYTAKDTDVRQQAEKLKQECKFLIKELQSKLDERRGASD